MLMPQSHTYRINFAELSFGPMPPAGQKCGKRMPVPSQTAFQNIFSCPSEKIKTPDTQTNPTNTVKLNYDNGLQKRWKRMSAGNKG
jgi:hypothetical protein